jgi:beta-glucosidase/6-phospho-beta-glucosidase/beta-galactosidase
MEEDCGTVNESPLIPQETVFKAYNGSVHKWVTFNEPVVFCSQASFRAAIL